MIGIISINTACDKINLFEDKKSTEIKKRQHKNATNHAQNARFNSQKKPDNVSGTKLSTKTTLNNIEQQNSNNSNSIINIHPTSTRRFGSIRKRRELNIAILLPLSGQHARMGQSMLDAVQLASAELGTGRINMVAIDSGSTVESAATALSKLDNNIDVIVGPALTEQVEIVNRYSCNKDIANITFVNDKNFSKLSNLFMFGMPLEQQMSRVISYATQRGVKNIFTLIPNNSIGESIEALLIDYKNSREINNFIAVKYNNNKDINAINFSQPVEELKTKITAFTNYHEDSIILLPQSGAELRKISQKFELIKDTNLKKTKVVCGSNFHDTGIFSITWSSDPWFADVATSSRADFAARFRATNKYDPHHLASLAYDAAALILAVIDQDNNNLMVFNPKSLLNKTGFEGINGVFRFAQDGSGERLLSVFKLDSNQVIEIDPALNSFK